MIDLPIQSHIQQAVDELFDQQVHFLKRLDNIQNKGKGVKIER